MSSPTLFHFENIESSIKDIKTIANKVGAVSTGLNSCASTLGRSGTSYTSYVRSARQIANNVSDINKSLLQMHNVLREVKQIYYRAEAENFRVITGAKAYETLNLQEKLVYHGKKIGNAVVSEMSQIYSALSTMSTEDKLRLGLEFLKLGAVTLSSALVLGSYVVTAPTGVGIVLAGLTLGKSISLVSKQMASTYAALKGDFSKANDVGIADIAFSYFPAMKFFPAINTLNSFYGFAISDAIGTGFEGLVNLTDLAMNHINNQFGVGNAPINAVAVGEDVVLSFIEEGIGVFNNDIADFGFKVGKLGYEFLRAYALGF